MPASSLRVERIELVVECGRGASARFPWPHWVQDDGGEPPGHDPVLHVRADASVFVGEDEPGVIVLRGDASLLEIGTFVAALIEYGAPREEALRALSAQAALAKLVDLDGIVVAGGVRLYSERGLEVSPGCCAGAESFSEWIAPRDESWSPWCGHDPGAYFTVRDDVIDVQLEREVLRALDRASFEAALAACAREARAFCGMLRRWLNERCTPEVASAIAARIERDWGIGAEGV